MPLYGDDKRKYDRERLKNIRDIWFEKNGPCVNCGSREKLELDHKNRTDKISHRIWSWSEQRRSEELAKCQVLCRDCHKEKTYKELSILFTKPLSELKHGSSNAYNVRGCRCDRCKQYRRNRHLRSRLAASAAASTSA